MGRPALELAGQRFHHMTVILRVHKAQESGKQKSWWLARCDCGREIIATGVHLKGGAYQSCGCMRRVLIKAKNTKHGMSHHPLYAVWDTMIARCHRPSHKSYGNYGAAGIHVCPAWRKLFQNFLNDMGSGYATGLTLDRINGRKGYSKANCRWVTPKQQGNNTRCNRKVQTPKHGVMNAGEAADLYGIGRTTLSYRLDNGWPQESLFMTVSHANRIRR